MMKLIAVAVLLVPLLLWLRRRLGVSVTTLIYATGIFALVGYLTFTGRLDWFFALVAGVALALVKLLRSPIGFIGLGWLRRLFARRQAPAVFRSGHLLVRIDPFSGVIDGEVLAGEFEGRRLSQMSEDDLGRLMGECEESDPRAVRILNIYIKYLRRFGYGGGDLGGDGAETADANEPSLSQACEILGVREEDDWKTVSDARQRLLNRLHPDKGGSVWISQRINAAWETVCRRHPRSPDKGGSESEGS